jgi:hypothetical protein
VISIKAQYSKPIVKCDELVRVDVLTASTPGTPQIITYQSNGISGTPVIQEIDGIDD